MFAFIFSILLLLQFGGLQNKAVDGDYFAQSGDPVVQTASFEEDDEGGTPIPPPLPRP